MSLPIWGGVECSINRVGKRWFNQLQQSGHDTRPQDLELVADLGVRTLRYPVLWETTAPASPDEMHWKFADERLLELRRLNISPIVGLLHHGSGPHYTSLMDVQFPRLFADFAAKVAQRFPWITQYTPINEPLTTARFSGLYGHWYPHRRDDRSFARIFVNQCRATVLAMRAIRAVNSHAHLIQTEDLGTTYSTRHLAYQRDFDNERRWLTWDLLTGRVHERHPLWAFLLRSGIAADELLWFSGANCAPQIVGINHYVTSDRYLDHRLATYPNVTPGANAREPYVDTEAVRVLSGSYDGWHVIDEAWRRYRLPLALTEVHIASTPNERLLWFNEARNAALDAAAAGCNVAAMTAWSMFGSFNWDRLLRDQSGSYEAGVFDVSSLQPRPTCVAEAIRHYSKRSTGPIGMAGFGWWQRSERVIHANFASE